MDKLNTYHAVFMMYNPTPGVITVTGTSPEDVTEKIKKMAKDSGIDRIEIIEIVDIQAAPALEAIVKEFNETVEPEKKVN